jgi:hypothetical protein
MRLLPWAALRSDSKQLYNYIVAVMLGNIFTYLLTRARTWTCSMDMDIKHAKGHAEWAWAWTCSIEMAC